MRNGKNPNRSLAVTGYAPVVIASITHLPNQRDYHKKRFEVIQCSLETMRQNAGVDCDIIIWDNGSNGNLRSWLLNEYRPDYLIFSENVGKSIARASIVRMLPDHVIVGVSDDDIFFYPDWLVKQLEVFDTYPRVGTVSGWPVRTQFRFANRFTKLWGRQHAKYRVGRFISDDEEKDFCSSIGRDYDWHVPYTQDDKDVMLTYKGVNAYATGHHAQWIGRVKLIKNLVEYTQEAMPSERMFERAIDHARLLRLTTVERCSQHIGNVLDKNLEVLWRKNCAISAVAS